MTDPMQDIRVPKKRGRVSLVAALALLAAVFGSGLYIGINGALLRAQNQDTPALGIAGSGTAISQADLTAFWRAWQLLDTNFIEAHASNTPPTQEERIQGAIRGLVESYGDPYTVYLPPADAEVFNADVKGSFGGVGMEVGSDDKGNLMVIAPLKDSPAAKAGILAGDRIVAIGATSSATMPPDEAVKLIRGEIGTTVKITVMHGSSTDPTVIPIVRDTIVIPTIDFKRVQQDTYQISLYNFSAASAGEFRKALRAFMESGDRKLVLDLRGNPGGYLDAAVEMASFFLPTGAVIVTEDFRGKQPDIVNRSFGYDVFRNRNLKMAILVDQGSASAAEILAGALQAHSVAKLVGTRTFGKGSVQQVMDLGGGAELKITVARWLTPNGISISDGGLTPDITATTTVEDIKAGNDPQKKAALDWLKNQ